MLDPLGLFGGVSTARACREAVKNVTAYHPHTTRDILVDDLWRCHPAPLPSAAGPAPLTLSARVHTLAAVTRPQDFTELFEGVDMAARARCTYALPYLRNQW